MPPINDSLRSAGLRYGIAVIWVVFATVGRLALDPFLGDLFPFATLFFAVLIVARYGGQGPALLATALGGIASALILLPPRESYVVRGHENQVGLLLYLAVSVGISLLGGAMNSARRRAEASAGEAVRQREQSLATLASIGDAVVVTDLQGRVASMNPVAEALTGWTTSEAIGQPLDLILRFVNEESLTPIESPVLRVLREGVVVGLAGRTILIAKDGTKRPVDDSASPIRGEAGEITGVVLVFRDVTERRRAEDQIERSEHELADFFENVGIGLHWVGPDGTILRANRAELNLLGYSREEYVGRPITDFHVDQDVICDILARLKAGESLDDYPARLRCSDNSIKDVLIGSNVMRVDGEFVHTRCFTRDITDIKKSEHDLRQSEERLRLALDAGRMGVWDWNIRTNEINWSENLEPIHGLEPGTFEGSFEGFKQLIHPDDRDMVTENIARCLRERSGYDFEFRNVRPDGSIHWMAGKGKLLTDKDGEPARLIGVGMDVTDRKRAETELQESEQRFRELAEVVPHIVWTATAEGAVTRFNKRWYEYSGMTADASLQEDGWRAVLHPNDLIRLLKMRDLAVGEGAKFEDEYRLRDRNGIYRWHLVRSVPVHDPSGRVLRRYGTATDIDDRKRAEQAARFLADASATLSGLVDYESTLQKVAGLAVPTFADWVVVDMMEIDGSMRRLAVAHADASKVELAMELDRRYPAHRDDPHGVPNVFRTGQSEWIGEIPDPLLAAAARNEEHLEILRDLGLKSYLCVPLKVRDETVGVISFVAAESGRRYDKLDLAVAEDLVHRAGVAIENARLYGELKQADRSKNEFLATLAHELRNPLAPIRNTLHLMRQSDGDAQGMEAERAMAERQVVHLARLIDDLMDVARITRGKIELHKEVVDLRTIVRQAVETASPLIVERRHELTVSLPDEAIRLEGDPTRLEQVLWNLLNNAAKYSAPGGQIELAAERDGDFVVLRARDTGIGIKAEMLPKVFDMFVQVGDHKNHAQGGLGIGLSLVRTLVELHGGSIVAKSDGPGKGSEFVVRMPILSENQESKVARPKVSREPEDGPSPHRRILVVDDNVDAAKSLARVLTRLYNQEVQVAHDGPEALTVASEFRPDVILLDIGLPGMSGYQVAEKLRGKPEFGRTLIVALTGWGQNDDRRRSIQAGIDHHLVKPVDPDNLLRLLDTSLAMSD